MYFDSDMSKLMQRYVGRQVTVQTHGYSRIIGQLASVHESCIRLRNVVRLHELEDSRWYGEIERSQQEELETGDAETLIATHAITCVSCSEYPGELEEDIESYDDETLDDRPPQVEEVSDESVTLANLFVGAGLAALLANDRSDLQRVKGLRRDIRDQLGFLIPTVRVRDDFTLDTNAYRLVIGGVEAAAGEVRLGKLLALQGPTAEAPDGEHVRDPVFQIPATWISSSERSDAELKGCTVVDVWGVIITHMGEAMRRHAASLLSYEETNRLLQSLRDSFPSLINDHFTDPDSVLRLHRVFAELLEDGIPIQHPERIATAVAQAKRMAEEQALLHVRRTLLTQLTGSAMDRDGRVSAACLSADSQRRIASDDLSVSQLESQRIVDEATVEGRAIFERRGRLAIVVDESTFHVARKSLRTLNRRCLVVTSSEARSMSRLELVGELGRASAESSREPSPTGAAVAKPR